MAYKGDTVRFEVKFLGFDGEELEIAPEQVTFKVYAYPQEELFSVELDHTYAHLIEDNHFFYDYTIPNDFEGTYFYEFKGLFRNNPFVAREDFEVDFE